MELATKRDRQMTRVIEGTAVLGFRAIICIQGLQMHLKYNGKMMLTRMATPKNLRAIATEYTGKVYARSRKGMELALADMEALRDGKSLAEIGNVAVVNKEVGGMAADLA